MPTWAGGPGFHLSRPWRWELWLSQRMGFHSNCITTQSLPPLPVHLSTAHCLCPPSAFQIRVYDRKIEGLPPEPVSLVAVRSDRLSVLYWTNGNAARPPMNTSVQPSIYSALTNQTILLRRLALVRMSASRPSALLTRSWLVRRPANTCPEGDQRKCPARAGLLQLLGSFQFYLRLTPPVPEM